MHIVCLCLNKIIIKYLFNIQNLIIIEVTTVYITNKIRITNSINFQHLEYHYYE